MHALVYVYVCILCMLVLYVRVMHVCTQVRVHVCVSVDVVGCVCFYCFSMSYKPSKYMIFRRSNSSLVTSYIAFALISNLAAPPQKGLVFKNVLLLCLGMTVTIHDIQTQLATVFCSPMANALTLCRNDTWLYVRCSQCPGWVSACANR